MYKILLITIFSISTLLSHNIPDFLKMEYEFREYRPEFSHIHKHSINNYKFLEKYNDSSYINQRPYDALSYDLFLDWSNLFNVEENYYSGINKVKIKVLELTGNIEFDKGNLTIDSVFAFGKKLDESKYNIDNQKLIIFDKSIEVGDTIEYDIYYSKYSGFNKGIYVYLNQVYPIAYTQSEPEDAQHWFPCNDRPYDKVISSIAIKVPNQYTATSNGFIDTIVTDEDYHTFYYSHPYPITTYLMVANASEYKTHQDWYKRVTNPNDSIPIDYYYWETDVSEADTFQQNTRNAKYAYRNVPGMIETLANLYGEYPYEKYGMSAVEPYGFGGMEHQTHSTVHRNWLYGYAGLGILHEIAHQWIGDLITCATWNDIWINEGGATFSEHIFAEKWTEDPSYYEAYTNDKIKRVLDDNAVETFSLHSVPVNKIFNDAYQLVYYKGALVYHMLRYHLGDEIFFNTLKGFIQSNRFTSVESKDFANYFIDNIDSTDTDLNLEQYFKQWIFGIGYPIYSISGNYNKLDESNYDVNIEINQIQNQDGFYEKYEMPLELVIAKSLFESDTIKIYNNKQKQIYNLELDYVPRDISVRNYSVLNESIFYDMTDITGIEESDDNFSIYPNPVYTDNNLFINSNTKNLSYEIFNSFGDKITSGIYINQIPIEKHTFSPGLYYLVLKNNGEIQRYKFIVMH